MIDIDRLHYVVLNRDSGSLPRRSGKTFARACEIASCVALGYSRIYCRVTCYRDVSYISKMLYQVFDDYCLPISQKSHFTYNSLTSVIKFISESSWEFTTRGNRGIYIPIGHKD